MSLVRGDEDSGSDPVERRFRDFVWLEESLHYDVPGAILPVLPDKDFPVAAQNKAFLEARATACTVFLTAITENPEVCESDVARSRVFTFLSGTATDFANLKQKTLWQQQAKEEAGETDGEATAAAVEALGADPDEEEMSPPPTKSSWGSSMFAAATAVSRVAGNTAARLRAATATVEKTEDEIFVERLMNAAKQKAAAMEGVEARTRALLVCVEKLANATKACGVATKAATVATLERCGEDAAVSAAGAEVAASLSEGESAGVEFEDASVAVKSPIACFGSLSDHQMNVQTPALRGLLQRQVVGLFDPLRAHMVVMRGVGRALGTLQSRTGGLRRLMTNLEVKKTVLQRAYDNPKTTDVLRRELEGGADKAQAKVDAAMAHFRSAMERFRREYDRFQAEKNETLQEILLIWAKLHQVRTQV